MKPYQLQFQMIREGLIATLEDETHGPPLLDYLATKLGSVIGLSPEDQANLALAATALQPASALPPYRPIDVTGTNYSLSMDDHLCILELLTNGCTVLLRQQSVYAWPITPLLPRALIQIRSRYPFVLDCQTNVVIDTNAAGTNFNCEAHPKAITLHMRATNIWGATGALVPV